MNYDFKMIDNLILIPTHTNKIRNNYIDIGIDY